MTNLFLSVLLYFVFMGGAFVVRYPFVKWDEHLYKRTIVSANIVEVRTLTGNQMIERPSEGGHPIAGAVLGGLATGDILGAVAGGILGSEVGNQRGVQQTQKVITGCYITAEVVDDGFIFNKYIGNYYSVHFCAIARKGDKINLDKVTTRSSGNSEYSFHYSRNPNFF